MKKLNILHEYIYTLILEKISDDPMFNQQPQQQQSAPNVPELRRRRKVRRVDPNVQSQNPGMDAKPRKTFDMPDLSKNPKVKDVQEHIYVMKRRIGELDVISYLAKLKKSYDDFNNRITKYDTNRHEILKYLVLLKSNATALSGVLESITAECEELENKLKD